MGRYTVVPSDTFDTIQLDAGVLLKHFDIDAAAAGEDGFSDDDIICATTGGVNPSCVPTYSDLGSDVDNVPVNTKDLKHLDSWECKISTTSLGTSAQLIRLSLGCADINAETGAIVPRADLLQTDFSDLWWVGDKANGGLVAIQLKNALATTGFSLQTTKNGKGTISLELTGHVSLQNQKEIPMVFYSIDPAEPTPVVTPSVTLNKDATTIVAEATETLTATTVPADAVVTWTSSDNEVASVEDGVVTAVAEGEATITASITVDGTDYTDTCTVTVSDGV